MFFFDFQGPSSSVSVSLEITGLDNSLQGQRWQERRKEKGDKNHLESRLLGRC